MSYVLSSQDKTHPTKASCAPRAVMQGLDSPGLLFLGHLDVQADSYYTCPTCSDRKNQRALLAVAHLWGPCTLKSLPHRSCFQWRLPLSSHPAIRSMQSKVCTNKKLLGRLWEALYLCGEVIWFYLCGWVLVLVLFIMCLGSLCLILQLRPACNSLNNTCWPWNSWQSPCLSVLGSGIMLGAIMPVFAFDKSLTLLFKRGIERLWWTKAGKTDRYLSTILKSYIDALD